MPSVLQTARLKNYSSLRTSPRATTYNTTTTDSWERDTYTGDDATATEASDARADSSRRRRLQLLDLLAQDPRVFGHFFRYGTLYFLAAQRLREALLRPVGVPPPVPEAMRNLRLGAHGQLVALHLRLEARLDLLEPREAPDTVGLEVALVVEGFLFLSVEVFQL